MRIKELHEILQKNKNGKVTQNDIARAIGTSRANVSKLFAKNSFINDDKLEKIEEYFGVNIKSLQSGLMYVDYYPEEIAFIKDGEIVMSEKSVKCAISPSIFPVKQDSFYMMCHSQDNSMAPVIMEGDFVIAEKSGNEEIVNNKMYLFMYNGNIYIKKLVKNINQIVVLSENKDYPAQYIEKGSISDFHVFGKIVYIGRTLNKV